MARLHEVVLALAAEMLVLGELAATLAEARAKAQARLDDGSAAEIFARMVAALGGPADFVERHDAYLPRAARRPALRRGRRPASSRRWIRAQIGLAVDRIWAAGGGARSDRDRSGGRLQRGARRSAPSRAPASRSRWCMRRARRMPTPRSRRCGA